MWGMLQTGIAAEPGATYLNMGIFGAVFAMAMKSLDLAGKAIGSRVAAKTNGGNGGPKPNLLEEIRDLKRDHKDQGNRMDRIELNQKNIEDLLREQHVTQLIMSENLRELKDLAKARRI